MGEPKRSLRFVVEVRAEAADPYALGVMLRAIADQVASGEQSGGMRGPDVLAPSARIRFEVTSAYAEPHEHYPGLGDG